MREDGLTRRDVVVALTLAALLLLAVGTAAGVVAEIAGRVMVVRMLQDLPASGVQTLSLAPVLWTRLLIAEAGLQVGAVVAGRLVAGRLLRAGADPDRRLYLLAAAAPLALAVLGLGVRLVAGVPAADLALALAQESLGVAGAVFGCWWACRRWESAAGPLWRG